MDLTDCPTGYAVTHPNHGCAHYVADKAQAERLAEMLEDGYAFAFEPIPDYLQELLSNDA